jgi:hypothetical protein
MQGHMARYLNRRFAIEARAAVLRINTYFATRFGIGPANRTQVGTFLTRFNCALARQRDDARTFLVA